MTEQDQNKVLTESITDEESKSIRQENYVISRVFIHEGDLIIVSDVPSEYFQYLSEQRKVALQVNVIDSNYWCMKLDRLLFVLEKKALAFLKEKQIVYFYLFDLENPERYLPLFYKLDLETLLKIEGIMDFLEKSKFNLTSEQSKA